MKLRQAKKFCMKNLYCKNCKQYTENVKYTGNYIYRNEPMPDHHCVTWWDCKICGKNKKEHRDYFETYPLWMKIFTLVLGLGATFCAFIICILVPIAIVLDWFGIKVPFLTN
jgi:hypothetical protein